MSEWREVTLGDVAELKRGYDLPAADRRNGTVPIVSSSGRTGFHDEAKVRGPGVVTGRYGTLGAVFYIEEDFWPLNTALYVRDFKGNHPKFVAALLASLELGRSEGAAAVPGVNRNHLHVLPVTVPDPETQSRIAEILGVMDDLIENNRRRIALLERLAQAIYREWFVHFRYPGHEDDELVDSSLGPIPAGWELRELQDIASAVTDTVDPAEIDPETPAVGLEHIPRRSLTLVEWGRADGLASRKARFLTGDVLFGKIRPYFHKVCVAPCDGICSTDAIVIRAIDERFRGLVTMSVFSDGFVAHAVATSNGTKMPRADWKVLRTWNVSVPPERILAAFENAVTDSLDMCRLLAAQGRELATLRDQLLPKLVTGAIDVSHLDLDALLEAPAA